MQAPWYGLLPAFILYRFELFVSLIIDLLFTAQPITIDFEKAGND